MADIKSTINQGKSPRTYLRHSLGLVSWYRWIPLIIIIAINVLIWAPLLPQFWFKEFPETTIAIDSSPSQLSVLSYPNDETDHAEIRRLIIPKIGVDAVIYEGTTEKTLDKGIWHIPTSGTPEEGGNMVLTAHRYLYTSGPKTFYYLNKLAPGDKIVIDWAGQKIVYKVARTFEIHAAETDITNRTTQQQLTLYTCDLYRSDRRLVVQANPEKP